MNNAFRILSRSFVMATAMTSSAILGDDAVTSASKSALGTTEYVVSPELQNVPVEEIERAYEGRTPPEAIRMYLAIAKGSRMGAGEGWFGPAQTRYDWEWLAKLHGVSPDDGISSDAFKGPANWFPRLDRNRDGKIAADDLDWSERNPWVQQAYSVNRLFRKIDPNSDGKLTRDEWLQFFESIAQGKNEISSEQLRETWLSGMVGFLPGDAPTPEILMKGLFSGEVGSLQEGPQVNDTAPDFCLKTQDGSKQIRLSEVIGKKPVVLVFGNFTCGPFRSMYAGVEDIYRRFKDDAVFLGVYVREAHPTDGWKMESNAKVGVSVAQPKTYAERKAVAEQCHSLLKYSIPLLVDEIDDSTGNAYSGMPARLYVIDRNGKVAFKNGRGPFGFKTGEMEQALLMTLLDEMQ
jgi:alkyl hydroperoxide reductase subunit AhpC